jgi:hypothetical protein
LICKATSTETDANLPLNKKNIKKHLKLKGGTTQQSGMLNDLSIAVSIAWNGFKHKNKTDL